MRLQKYVSMGECYPFGYRKAWRDLSRWQSVAYPIGIHLIARWIHRLWELSYRYSPSKLELLLAKQHLDTLEMMRPYQERECQRHYERGLEDGRAAERIKISNEVTNAIRAMRGHL